MKRAYLLLFLTLGIACELVCQTVTQAQVDARAVIEVTSRDAPQRPSVPRMPAAVRRVPQHVLLARTAVGEASSHVSDSEVVAMHSVFLYRQSQTGVEYADVVWGFSHAIRNPNKSWLHRLGENDNHLRAPHYIRDHWPRVLEAARRAVAGEAHVCTDAEGNAVRLVDFGGPHVDRGSLARMMRRNGWRTSSNCSGAEGAITANSYLYDPTP